MSISNIASNIPRLSNVTLPNIFFGNFNMQTTQDTIDKIPDLTPKTDLKTRNFNVKINGNVQSVKSVKSFKWLVLKSEVAQVQEAQPTQSVQSAQPTIARPLVEQQKTVPTQQAPTPSRKNNTTLPDFLNSLPDSIN